MAVEFLMTMEPARCLLRQVACGTLPAWWARQALTRALQAGSLASWEGNGSRSMGERAAAIALAIAYCERGGRL